MRHKIRNYDCDTECMLDWDQRLKMKVHFDVILFAITQTEASEAWTRTITHNYTML